MDSKKVLIFGALAALFIGFLFVRMSPRKQNAPACREPMESTGGILTQEQERIFHWGRGIANSTLDVPEEEVRKRIEYDLVQADLETRVFILWMLEELGNVEWTPIAQHGLKDSNTYVRLRAAKALSRVDPENSEECMRAVESAEIADARPIYTLSGIVRTEGILELEKSYTAHRLQPQSEVLKEEFLQHAKSLIEYTSIITAVDSFFRPKTAITGLDEH